MKTYLIVMIVSITIIGSVLYFLLKDKKDNGDVQFVNEAYTSKYKSGFNEFPQVLLIDGKDRPEECPESSKPHYKSTCEWSDIDTAKTNCDNMDGTNNHNSCIGFFKDNGKYYAIAEPQIKTIYYNNRTTKYD